MPDLFLQINFDSFTLVIETLFSGVAVGSLLYSGLPTRLENRIVNEGRNALLLNPRK